MKNIVILGSTGSIGRSALSVVAGHPDKYRIVGLTANNNLDLLLEQARIFKPQCIAVASESKAQELKRMTGIPVFAGEDGLCRVASMDEADYVLSAIVGSAGLLPTMSAVKSGKTIGLANKETLVVAGRIFMDEAVKSGSRILPVDSEHSAVFQCIDGKDPKEIRKITLTASGGPFAGMSKAQLSSVTPQQALKHPSWSMGRKITIDSATLMNKGLEVIEAHYLFGLKPEHIGVVVHPQSIVHCIVEFQDGCSISHMSVPDMRAAIAFSLSYPNRLNSVVPALDLGKVGHLDFMKPDYESFPCLSFAYDALRVSGTMPAVLNAANEVAVNSFLEGEIGFNDMPEIIKSVMSAHTPQKADSIQIVLNAHAWAQCQARLNIEAVAKK